MHTSTARSTAAFVRGLQGNDPKYWQTAALLKHFLANSNENGRMGSSSNFDEAAFCREYYSVPFRMGFEAGARSYMAAYNAMNGIPMTAQPILKENHYQGVGGEPHHHHGRRVSGRHGESSQVLSRTCPRPRRAQSSGHQPVSRRHI